MQPPNPMVWRRVTLSHDGKQYDIDQDLNATLSRPLIKKDKTTGEITEVTGAPDTVKMIASSLTKKGLSYSSPTSSSIQIDLREFKLTYPFDDDLRRFAIKMSLAVARHLQCIPVVSDDCRTYLLTGQTGENGSPVYMALEKSPDLNAMRPPMGHVIYLRQNPTEGRTYSIVQLFGGIQLYCDIGADRNCKEFSIVGVHDPITHQERFESVAPIDYAPPDRFVPADQLLSKVRAIFENMRQDLVKLYGDQAPTSLGC